MGTTADVLAVIEKASHSIENVMTKTFSNISADIDIGNDKMLNEENNVQTIEGDNDEEELTADTDKGVVVDVEQNENEKLNVTEESTNETECSLEADATPEKVNIEQEQEICKETDVKERECGEGEISKNAEKEEMEDKEMTGNGTVILTEDDTDEVK